MAAGSGQNIASGTLASDSTDLNQTLALFRFSRNQNRSAPLSIWFTRSLLRNVCSMADHAGYALQRALTETLIALEIINRRSTGTIRPIYF